MKRSVIVLVLASIAAVFATGCASTGLPSPSVAFEPRVYPYVPEVAVGTEAATIAK
jgi:hypothetical protein